MNKRPLILNKLKYLFPLRNKHFEYRRQCRKLLKELQWNKVTTSKRKSQEQSKKVFNLWAEIESIIGFH